MDYEFRPSPNYNGRRDGQQPTLLILHYTGMKSAQAAIDRLCDPESEVSAHYVVDEQGHILQLVDEENRAWHAGVGFWRGERDINSASIGVEIVNPGHEFGYRSFPEQQMQAVISLSRDIVVRHNISPWNVVGHSDIAPLRKEDPGELFDWKRLAAQDVGLWVEPTSSITWETEDICGMLAEIGYELDDTDQLSAVVRAFQRHWRPSVLTGEIDQETADIAYALQNEVKRLT